MDTAARPGWYEHTLFVANFFESFMRRFATTSTARARLEENARTYKTTGRTVYTNLLTPGNPSADSYSAEPKQFFDRRSQEIRQSPAKEKEAIEAWYETLKKNDDEVATSLSVSGEPFSVREAYECDFGIATCHNRIYLLWFNAFIKQLPELLREIERGTAFIKEKKAEMDKVQSEDEAVEESLKQYKPYVERYVLTFKQILRYHQRTVAAALLQCTLSCHALCHTEWSERCALPVGTCSVRHPP